MTGLPKNKIITMHTYLILNIPNSKSLYKKHTSF